ncbi:MAG: hypothetical protein ACYS47_10015, partial [Planctomycetota bacterium]|jgi:hypothetical protein
MVYHLDEKLSTIYGRETRGPDEKPRRTFLRADREWICEFPGKKTTHYEIHQPNVHYPDDDVLVWEDLGRNKRAFTLSPGTKVDVVEITDGYEEGTPHVMYRIRTADGREGWVPEKWCKKVTRPGKSVCTLSEDTPHYNELSSAILVLRKLDLSRPATYLFPGIAWPRRLDRGEDLRTLDRSAIKDVKVTVNEAGTFELDGTEIQAVKVVVEAHRGERTSSIGFTLTPDNRLLAFGPEKNPAPFTLCKEEDVKVLFEKKEAGPESAITSDGAFALSKSAFDEWMKAFVEAEDKSQVKSLTDYLDKACRKAGAESWSDYCSKAALALGPEAWAQCAKRIADYQQKKLKELTERLTKKAGGEDDE